MKEVYKVKSSERVVFGAPMYFEQCTKEELKQLAPLEQRLRQNENI